MVRTRTVRRESQPGSRERLFAAAAAEFARRGFAGANVDRIARSARLNKAMIYYHFGSKAALYREILQDVFGAIARRAASIADSGAPPEEKVRAFVLAIATEAESRPHFPPIWLREVAEGGTHLDDTTVAHMGRVLKSLGRIVREGVKSRRFAPTSAFLVHAGIVAPLLLFFATSRLRERVERGGVGGVRRIAAEEVVAHVQRVALATLEGRIA